MSEEVKTITMKELFVDCVKDEMKAYLDRRREAERQLARKGKSFVRGGHERMTERNLWQSDWIAEQYMLCCEKKCQEPTAIRRIIEVIGSAAAARLNHLVDLYNKEQEKQQKAASEEK